MIWIVALYAAIAAGVTLAVSLWDSQPGLRQLSTRDKIMAGLGWPGIVFAVVWMLFENDEDYKS